MNSGREHIKNYIGLELLECEDWKCVSVCTCTGLEVSVYIQLLEMCTCESVCVCETGQVGGGRSVDEKVEGRRST